jgi:DNA polymerase-3 subunit gamma/tau
LLDTIRSRSQRFDFHPVPIEELAGHLSLISDREGYKTDPAALIAISRHAGGSVRDSLSLLEQVAALGAGSVDVAGVRRALGLADSEAFMRLVEAVAEQDAKAALELVAELAADGVDLRRFVAESVSFFRGAFLAHYAPNLAEISDEPADVYESWRKAAQLVSAADVLRAVDLLGDALVRLREGREERLMTELALIKLTRPETSSDAEALLSRVERIERRLGKPDPVPAPGAAGPALEPSAEAAPPPPVVDAPAAVPPAPVESGNGEVEKAQEATAPDVPAIDVSFEQLQKVWPGLFGSLRDVLGARRWAFFREAVPAAVEGNVIVLEVPHGFHLQSLQEDDAVAAIVATRAGDLLGGTVRVRFGLRESVADSAAEQTIDMNQLEERPAGSTDPTSLLASELGAEVVDE